MSVSHVFTMLEFVLYKPDIKLSCKFACLINCSLNLSLNWLEYHIFGIYILRCLCHHNTHDNWKGIQILDWECYGSFPTTNYFNSAIVLLGLIWIGLVTNQSSLSNSNFRIVDKNWIPNAFSQMAYNINQEIWSRFVLCWTLCRGLAYIPRNHEENVNYSIESTQTFDIIEQINTKTPRA